ncbi:iron uptake transporter deferrochelatase/peroxidase subunit [Streptomyces sp. NPDC059837]|jgi:deferrochelatase/peroxidase EfeB|uniref:iron uptake transporter deferrochelatase/peroxidase subunit n=1 Tax=unclassified Streptomyces TaxID=2593676 RepID=UPI00224F969C|nr:MULTISPECIES: iron uptake transporter deferrochelatase/peroxidase subunit [unclassified Streptomyces]MCX4401136.1 iron uptake transporter deferrochelatase/peroxidase subunit [Streptomyces sp. NBC_01764]MCX4453703.1 iron uptake transporter deferrochelatase/peroxidase subunit [Streptomyces sp. NBC_01719]MCX4493063.1 iron uptake transporter deferrochelatase/peroxidase subunit [Streptomyces sp. NBC_01728]MCX5089854.1 iron uptake transporter deferrochelatase/peroxidase subunit [Streptomyces sp. N
MTTDTTKTTDGPTPSRRSLIGWGGAGLALGAAAAGGAVAMTRTGNDVDPAGAETGAAIAFHGAHQAGIATPVQDRLHFASFDVKTDDRAEFVQMLKDWTAAARRMTAGHAVGEGAYGGLAEAPPDDTGEALGLKPSRLTLTIGFGPSLFEKYGEKFGLTGLRPEALVDLPEFPGDNLEKARSDGDLCIQACADDPQVAVHAIRNLARIGFGKVAVRWSQLGFGKTSSTTPDAQTPRNLMGFKDGTRNIAGTEPDRLKKFVWVGEDEGPAWMAGGSYLVARRIRMNIETWDRTSLQEQEDVFGRDKGEGAPVGKAKERDEPFLKAMKPDAHVRLAHPDSNGGITLLRRGYSFTDGTDGLGRLEAGLFFLAYQRDVRKGFIPVQRSLARSDALNEYIQHVSSAVFAVPPGVRDKDDWWGRALFSKEA